MTTITKRASLFLNVLVLGIGLTLFLGALHAQTQTATVFGVISRQNNQPATRVLVSIASKIAYTDDGGRYRIDGVPLGTQPMLVSSGGKVLLNTTVRVASNPLMIDQKLP